MHRPKSRHGAPIAALVIGVFPLVPTPLFAQAESGAQSLLIDPSIRASGMGRASNGVFWGADPNYWANPSLLGYRRGLRYEWGSTQLVPDLADDVFFKTKRLTLGYGGLAVSMSGKPVAGIGNQRLDYGVSVATDQNGDPLGTFTSYEDIRSFGVAGSVLELTQTIGRVLGAQAPRSLARYGDLSVGWSAKRTEVFLAPASMTVSGLAGRGDVTTYDSGLLVRVTPYNSIDYPGLLEGVDRLASLRVDVGHGRSTQNYNEAEIAYIDPDQRDPVARISRRGWATRVAIDLPRERRVQVHSGVLRRILDFTTPLAEWSKAWDRVLPTLHDPLTGQRYEKSRILYDGWELTLANIFSVRRGRVDDPDGIVHGTTTGWGLGLSWGDLAGFRYDRATVPQSVYLGNVDREGFIAYADPVKLWKEIDRGAGSVAAPATASSAARPKAFGLAAFAGYQAYSMSDVNDAIGTPGTFFPGATANADKIEGGASFGGGFRFRPSKHVGLALDVSHLLAKTEGTGVFLGTAYDGELNVPATSVTGTLIYFVRATGRTQLGLGAGAGYYVCAGEASATASGIQYASDLDGSGFGLHGEGVGEISLVGPLWAEISTGYRYARTTEVKFEGAALHNADGSKSQVDWSGFMARAGLTVYVGGSRSGPKG